MNETELENLVVRLTGDSKGYTDMLKSAEASTAAAATAVTASANKIETIKSSFGGLAKLVTGIFGDTKTGVDKFNKTLGDYGDETKKYFGSAAEELGKLDYRLGDMAKKGMGGATGGIGGVIAPLIKKFNELSQAAQETSSWVLGALALAGPLVALTKLWEIGLKGLDAAFMGTMRGLGAFYGYLIALPAGAVLTVAAIALISGAILYLTYRLAGGREALDSFNEALYRYNAYAEKAQSRYTGQTGEMIDAAKELSGKDEKPYDAVKFLKEKLAATEKELKGKQFNVSGAEKEVSDISGQFGTRWLFQNTKDVELAKAHLNDANQALEDTTARAEKLKDALEDITLERTDRASAHALAMAEKKLAAAQAAVQLEKDKPALSDPEHHAAVADKKLKEAQAAVDAAKRLVTTHDSLDNAIKAATQRMEHHRRSGFGASAAEAQRVGFESRGATPEQLEKFDKEAVLDQAHAIDEITKAMLRQAEAHGMSAREASIHKKEEEMLAGAMRQIEANPLPVLPHVLKADKTIADAKEDLAAYKKIYAELLSGRVDTMWVGPTGDQRPAKRPGVEAGVKQLEAVIAAAEAAKKALPVDLESQTEQTRIMAKRAEIHAMFEAMRKADIAATKNENEQRDWQAVQHIIEQTLTPLEKLRKEKEELNRLFKDDKGVFKDAISGAEVYEKALAQAEKRARGVEVATRAAVAVGSAEAASRMEEYRRHLAELYPGEGGEISIRDRGTLPRFNSPRAGSPEALSQQEARVRQEDYLRQIRDILQDRDKTPPIVARPGGFKR